MPDAQALADRYRDWSLRGLPILQAPIDMDFGRTFVALDPDGHRLRVFAPREEPAARPTPWSRSQHSRSLNHR